MTGSEAVAAVLMMGLLLVVMLVVPWLVAAPPTSDGPDREGRLWIALGLVQVTIWSTLGPAQIVASELRSRGLLVVSTTVVMVLIVIGAGVLWSRRRPGVLEVIAALGLGAAYLMVMIRSGLSPEERTHLFEYGIVALLAYEAMVERRRAGRAITHPWPTALLLASVLGAVDEGIQMLIPSRTFDPRDILFNTIAAVMALTSVAVMRGARGYARRRLSR